MSEDRSGGEDPGVLRRTVRFGDTDAAGVMHFHQLLRWCHEAYEESLQRHGIPAAEVFPVPHWSMAATLAAATATAPEPAPLSVALPIVHCAADYLRPIVCGDALTIRLSPQPLDPGRFEVRYEFLRGGETVGRGLTRHRAISATDRRPCDLPQPIKRWLKAFSPADRGPSGCLEHR